MVRPRFLVIAGLVVVLALHPWTWASQGIGDLVPTVAALAVVALAIVLCAIKLGDLRLPRRPARRPRIHLVRTPPARTADDVTRAAEEILRSSRPKR